MVCVIFLRIFVSFMMAVFLWGSCLRIRWCLLANSVRLMCSASSFVVRCLARVVFPVHGVPVMRMTRFMRVFGVDGLVIGCACGLVYWNSKLVIFCCFWFFWGFWCGCGLVCDFLSIPPYI